MRCHAADRAPPPIGSRPRAFASCRTAAELRNAAWSRGRGTPVDDHQRRGPGATRGWHGPAWRAASPARAVVLCRWSELSRDQPAARHARQFDWSDARANSREAPRGDEARRTMNVASPDLLTLLGWAERLAAGERCAEWESWCASSPEAAWKWERITEAQTLLAGNCSPGDEDAGVTVEELAAFLEGRLSSLDSSRVEQECWQSTAQLAELLSATRFAQRPLTAAPSAQLEARLL